MVQVLQASDLTLHAVKTQFNLHQVQEREFFPEWQVELPELTDIERHWLDQIKTDFLNLAEYSLHEEIVKLVVLGPLLLVAGLYQPPFLPVAERQVEIAVEDESAVVRGKIDLLVLHQHLWVVVIESKRKGLNVLEGLPQALLYMMSSPNGVCPTYGLVTNGSEFRFIKLVQGDRPQYALSDLLTLQRFDNDLYRVLKILKHLAQLVVVQA